ncbi:M16 family metallopeptidase, partial [uncultured Duncaniella sp.]|uniref:M16 family metallopeptidase n=1 Tax=uncultured Duncaniella sp. TaxID=2768039 RepID=UPI00351058A5
MKKFKIKALMVLSGLFMLGMSAQAQMPLPVDPEVRIGHLPNGMTYYIRHNETPKGQADFYIAQKVGSALEEDNQRGLAHFLEHMCFNGTENFPGNSLISWLESVGVKFGYNLNAYTSIDETVYNISNVPTDRESVQDSCLLILHDWADALLLDTEEINKERGVIHEEWRRTTVGQQRIIENLLPKIYPGSKYGYRLPIGTMEVVDNFDPQTLRDYYETWYRPDQQGIIVVGDIDVDRIENKIKELFSPIRMPDNAKERVYLDVPDTSGTIYAIGKDKEQTVQIAEMMFKTDAFPDSLKGDISYLAVNYLTSMMTAMLNNRLSDMMSDPSTPFAQ